MHGQKRINGLLFIFIFVAVSSTSWGASDLTQQGVAFLKAQRFDEAVKIFSKVIKDNPQDAQAIHFRGMARYYQGNTDQAIADYTRAIKINPQFAEAFTSRGVARFQKGDYKRAEEDLRRAYSKNPKDANALNQMAWMLAVCPDKQYRNGKKALDLARRVINLKTTPNFLDTLAAAYAETGQYQDAARIQRKVIALLSQEERLNNIEIYLDRLKKYEAHKPWRQTRPTDGETGVLKTEKSKLIRTKAPKNQKKAVTSPTASTKTIKPASKVVETVTQPKPGSHLFPYTIFISTYQNPKVSMQKTMRLKKMGDPAFVSHAFFKDTGHWYQIYYGWFKNAADAAQTSKKLKERKFRKAIVVKKPFAVQAAVSSSDAMLKKLETRLLALNYPAYRLPDAHASGLVRLLIGAYSTTTVPDKLISTLKKAGFKPKIVRR